MAKLAIPGGWLGVDFYPGCADCGTGYGLTLVKLDADHEDTEFLVEGVPDITFDRYGRWSQYIASLESLREVWREYADKDSEADDIMGDFIQHDGLRDVFYRTIRRGPPMTTPDSSARPPMTDPRHNAVSEN